MNSFIPFNRIWFARAYPFYQPMPMSVRTLSKIAHIQYAACGGFVV